MSEESIFRKAGFTDAAAQYPRSEASFRLLCAFNGVDPSQAPEAWRFYPNQAMSDAWDRVAAVAQEAAHRAGRIEQARRDVEMAQDDDGNFTWAGTDKGVAIRQEVAHAIAAAIRAEADKLERREGE